VNVLNVCREDSQNEYRFYLEAGISTSKQVDEDRLTYLNKGVLSQRDNIADVEFSILGSCSRETSRDPFFKVLVLVLEPSVSILVLNLKVLFLVLELHDGTRLEN